MENIDRKFRILAVNPVNGKIYTEANSLLLCAKDKAVPAALIAYVNECIAIGANIDHINSVELLIKRVVKFQEEIECRVPDTIGAEIPRCLAGDSRQAAALPHQLRVIEERQALDEKRQKLTTFIGGELYRKLDSVEQSRLNRQLEAMSLYSNILVERIAAFAE